MTEEQKKRYKFNDGETHGLELANHYHMTGQGGAPQLREFTDEEGMQDRFHSWYFPEDYRVGE